MQTSSIPVLVLSTLMATAAAQTYGRPADAGRVMPYPIDLPAGYVAAVEAGTRTWNGQPGEKHWTNYAHYDIAMELDVEQKRVTATATMTYLNRSPDTLRQLVVHLRQNMMKAGMMRTRRIVTTNGFELGDVRLNGEELGRRGSRLRDTRLYVRLNDEQQLEPGDKATLTIEYAFDVPKAGTAPRNGYEDDKVFYLAYWYPQFAVYDDVSGWVADPYRGNGEFYMGYADYEHRQFTAPGRLPGPLDGRAPEPRRSPYAQDARQAARRRGQGYQRSR